MAYVSDVSPEQILDIAEGVYHRGSLTQEQAAEYLGISGKYAERIAKVAQNLHLIENRGGVYYPTEKTRDAAIATKDQRQIIFKNLIVSFKPFVLFCYYLSKGNDVEEAARKVRVVSSLESGQPTVLKALKWWGSYAGVLAKSEDGSLKIEYSPDEYHDEIYIRTLLRATQDKFNANMFVPYKIGDEAYAFLSEEDLELLVKALTTYSLEPANSINDSSKVFESFLRKLGRDLNIDLTNLNGILRIASRLQQEGSVLTEHRQMCEFLSAFRNPANHGVQKSILEYWKIEKDSALEVILLFLTALRSIYHFTKKNDLML